MRVLAAVLVLATAGCRGEPVAPALQRYENRELAFTLEHPPAWTVTDAADEAMRRSLAIGIAKSATEMEETFSAEREVVSLRLARDGRTAARIGVHAKAVQPAAFLHGYLETLRTGANGVTVEVRESGELTLAGTRFLHSRLAVTYEGVPVSQEMLVTNRSGVAVLLAITAREPADFEAGSAILRSVRFADAP